MKDSCTVCFIGNNNQTTNSFNFTREISTESNTIPISIYADDSIHLIKQKILHGTKKHTDVPEYNLDEMYLFVLIERPFILLDWYKQITQNETIPLTPANFSQLLVNMNKFQQEPEEDIVSILQSNLLKTKKLT